LSLYKLLENRLIRLFSFKSNTKFILIFYCLFAPLIFNLSKAENNNVISDNKSYLEKDYLDSNNELQKIKFLPGKIKLNNKNIKKIEIDFLKSKKDLEDYIIDTGDALLIEFENFPRGLNSLKKYNQNGFDPSDVSYLEPKTNLKKYILGNGDSLFISFLKTPELNREVTINKQGEIFLPRIENIYVKGLTTFQLSKLLRIRYEEFLKEPELEISISKFKFINSGIYNVDVEGEIFLPKIKETYVRGLTPYELEQLLQKKYSEFNITAKTTVKIATFKRLRILVGGEIRSPGIYNFPAINNLEFRNIINDIDGEGKKKTFFDTNTNEDRSLELSKDFNIDYQDNFLKKQNLEPTLQNNLANKANFKIKNPSENFTTVSNAIRRAGGITSKSDLSRIEIIRDVPIGKGGGKKRAVIDFTSFLNESNPNNDIRLFDGDRIFLPKLISPSSDNLPKSILSGLSPRFITVDIFGRVENPGNIKLPLESTLSDAIDLTGPIRPLSGKIVLIRYNNDGTVLKKNISYSSRAKRGSKRNPFIKEGDLISVKNSLLGKSTGIIKEFTSPFIGIYSTKEIIESFND